jgi:hypothetical protein
MGLVELIGIRFCGVRACGAPNRAADLPSPDFTLKFGDFLFITSPALLVKP